MRSFAKGIWVAALGAGGVVAGLGLAGPVNAQDAAAGAKVFARCQVCHQVDPAKPSSFGPNLAGVVGRKAGTLPRFAYSPALVRYGAVWDEAKLDAFLAAPQKVVPGSRMAFPGLPSTKDRADVIAFLMMKK